MKIYLERNNNYLFVRINDNPSHPAFNLLYMRFDKKWVAPGSIYMEGLKLDSEGRIVIE